MRPFKLLSWLAVTPLFVFTACSSSVDTPSGTSGPTDEEVGEVLSHIVGQQSYYQDGAILAASMGAAAAIDSLATLVAQDPGVDWAVNNGTGVSIRWRNGLRGIVALRLLNEGTQSGKSVSDWTPSPTQSSTEPAGAAGQGIFTVPKHRKALYLAPCYSEFSLWDDSFIKAVDGVLPKVGFSPLTVYKDEEVTLARLCGVAAGDYGLIRIGSHGSPWPSVSDIQEVYVISGEIPTEASINANWEDLDQGHLAIGSYAGGNRYFFDSHYFTANNNFGDGNPFVSAGFCFGWLGGWPEDLRQVSKAGAVTGWDWETLASADAGKTEYVVLDMCDTTRTRPTTLQTWHTAVDPHYMEESRRISLHYSAADNFALWTTSVVQITKIDPVVGGPGDDIYISGMGFGTVRGAVKFGATPATVITHWSDTGIRVVIPEGLTAGPTPVTVVVGSKISNPYSVFVEDALFEKLHKTYYVDFYFTAWHIYEPWDAGDEVTFSHLLQPIFWEGNLFAGEKREVTESRRMRLQVYGSVGADGRSVSLEYVFADTSYSSGGRVEEYQKVRIEGLPFENTYTGTVAYDATGDAVQPHVKELEWRRTVYGEAGETIQSGEYLRTEWDWYPVDHRLNCGFRM